LCGFFLGVGVGCFSSSFSSFLSFGVCVRVFVALFFESLGVGFVWGGFLVWLGGCVSSVGSSGVAGGSLSFFFWLVWLVGVFFFLFVGGVWRSLSLFWFFGGEVVFFVLVKVRGVLLVSLCCGRLVFFSRVGGFGLGVEELWFYFLGFVGEGLFWVLLWFRGGGGSFVLLGFRLSVILVFCFLGVFASGWV